MTELDRAPQAVHPAFKAAVSLFLLFSDTRVLDKCLGSPTASRYREQMTRAGRYRESRWKNGTGILLLLLLLVTLQLQEEDSTS